VALVSGIVAILAGPPQTCVAHVNFREVIPGDGSDDASKSEIHQHQRKAITTERPLPEIGRMGSVGRYTFRDYRIMNPHA
jgi:hypothetical protein